MEDPKTILITGGSSGIGKALALYYAKEGARLFLTGRNTERLDIVARACRDKGAVVDTNLISVTDRVAMEQWITFIDENHPLDLVVANAGMSGGTGGAGSGEPFGQAREIFDVNLTGVINTIEPILPRMMERKSGQIAIMSSLAAFRGWSGAPAYSASKGAVRFYGEALRGSLTGTGVEINVICPGFVISRMTDANDYQMPFIMSAEKAAAIIARGLRRDKSRIAFPFLTHTIAWFISVIPDAIAQVILRRLPAKPQSIKDFSNKNEK